MNYTRAKLLMARDPLSLSAEWWRGEDSNLRRLSRQIYSLVPLTAREPLQIKLASIVPSKSEVNPEKALIRK